MKSQPMGDELLDQAFALLQGNKAAEAWELLKDANGSNPRATLYKAICLSAFGRTVNSALLCDRGLSLNPDRALSNQLEVLRDVQLRRLTEVATENWNPASEPSFTAVVVVGDRPVADFATTLQTLDLQQYSSAEVALLVSKENKLELGTLREQFPRIRITVSATASDNANLDLGALADVVQKTSSAVVQIVMTPVLYCTASLRSIGEIFKSSITTQWINGYRFFCSRDFEFKHYRMPQIRWSEEFFHDSSRFRYPSADLELYNVFFRREFLLGALSRLQGVEAPCGTTALLSSCFSECAPTFAAAELAGEQRTPFVETPPDAAETAQKIETLTLIRRRLGRGRAFSSESPQPIRLKSLEETSLKVADLRQLPSMTVTGVLPKISVVVPNYNQAELLELCLQSIVGQRYPKLELIVRDGGSTDGSLEVIKRYASAITDWTSGPDGGHYSAVNNGLRSASGEILCWINSTDLLTPWSLYSAAATFTRNPGIRWITGRVATITPSGSLYESPDITPLSAERYRSGAFDDPWIQQEGTYFRADLWREAGGSLDLSLSVAADLELWARFFRYAALEKITAVLGIFRYHEGQRSEQGRQLYYREALEVLERERTLMGNAKIPAEHSPPPTAPAPLSTQVAQERITNAEPPRQEQEQLAGIIKASLASLYIR